MGTPANTKSHPRAATAPAQPPKAATAASSSSHAFGSDKEISQTDWIISPNNPVPVHHVKSAPYSISSDARQTLTTTGLPSTNPAN